MHRPYFLLAIFIVVLYLGLRIPSLGTDIANSDAARWHRRSERFLTALKTGDFASTYQHYQPGVTLMWVNAVVKQATFSYQYHVLKLAEPKTLENADFFPIIHRYSKMANIAVLTLVYVFLLFAVAKLFSHKTALLFGFLVALEPYVVGIDRWFHLTSFEAYFALAAFLSLLVWHKNTHQKFLCVSAGFLALAVLSKLTALVVLVPIAVVFVHNFRATKNFRPVLLFALIFLSTSLLLFPALLVNPTLVLQKLSSAVFSAVGSDALGEQITGLRAVVYYPTILVFKMAPLTVVLLVVAVAKMRTVLKIDYVKYILLYTGVYLLALTAADKKIDRYSVALILPLLLYVAIYLSTLKTQVLGVICVLYVLFTLWVVYSFHPVYYAYYSPLFGPDAQNTAMRAKVYDNSGEYYAQAARYLNTRGRDFYTFVPFNVEAFSYFYEGNIQHAHDEYTNYIVTSVEHLDSLPANCSTQVEVFGPRLWKTVFVFACNPKL